jgi:hypothetical protein
LLAGEKIFFCTDVYLESWKLTRNFSCRCAHDVMDLGGTLAYQLATAFSSDMINDLARVVSSPLNKAIAAS